jgi:hypothetical protein
MPTSLWTSNILAGPGSLAGRRATGPKSRRTRRDRKEFFHTMSREDEGARKFPGFDETATVAEVATSQTEEAAELARGRRPPTSPWRRRSHVITIQGSA